jgi:threonine/homoserine/homoserine lactone efflux protein
MDLPLLIRGIVLGFSIAAPVGPIGMLCIRRTLANGRLHGFVSGLGAATADMLYGIIAALGLTAVSAALTSNAFWLRVIGGIFLIYLGITTFRSEPASQAARAEARGLLGSYLSTLFLTITNPLTILSFAAMFAALGAGTGSGAYGNGVLVALGVFLGSAAWWLLLSGSVSLIRGWITPARLRWVNRISGVLILIFAASALSVVITG